MESTRCTSRYSWLWNPSTIAGASAGLVPPVITSPLEIIKTRMQAQKATTGRVDYLGIIGASLSRVNLFAVC